MAPLEICRDNCSLSAVTKALEQGLDPNVQWEELDINYPKSTGGCVVNTYTPWFVTSWANMNTPLHMALACGHRDAAALLLDNGAQIDQLNALGRSSLHEAVRRQDYDAVRFLIHHRAGLSLVTEKRSLNDQDCERSQVDGVSPLLEAINTGDNIMVKMLVDAGAHVNQKTSHGWTLLDFALLERQADMMVTLMTRGAKLSRPASDLPAVLEDYTLKQRAKELLTREAVFPSAELHEFYLQLIATQEFAALSVADTPNSASKCSSLIGTLFDTLYSLTGTPNPHTLDGIKYCTQCIAFQRTFSTKGQPPFQHHSSRRNLQMSAENGCVLCVLLDDALTHGDGMRYGQCSIQYDHEGAAHVAILSDSNIKFDRVFKVHCGDESANIECAYIQNHIAASLCKTQDERLQGTASYHAFEMAQTWLKHCQTDHKSCSEGVRQDSELPSRVIDVGGEDKDPCIILGDGKRGSYCAFMSSGSEARPTTTTKAAPSEWTKALPLASLSTMLREAIIATRRLGIQYLWIDSLCIAQDDPDDYTRQRAELYKVYSGATLTLATQDPQDSPNGLFRPRESHLTSPVPLSVPFPKLQRQATGHSLSVSIFALPVQAEKALLKPGPLQELGWTFAREWCSTRILHFGPGLLFWECLARHASESDPEGATHPYLSSMTDFSEHRDIKAAILGRSSRKAWSSMPEDPKQRRFQAWSDLVSNFSTRVLSKQSDKVPAILGLSRIVQDTLEDEPVAGIWRGPYLPPSLLWKIEDPSKAVRNPNYPSWTWASVDGKCVYHRDSTMEMLPSYAKLDVQSSDLLQSRVSGTLQVTGTIRKFPSNFEFWKYDNTMGAGHGLFWMDQKELEGFNEQEVTDRARIVEGSKDVQDAPHGDIYCLAIGKIGKAPPPQFGYPVYPYGRPESVICLCLTPVDSNQGGESGVTVYRRMGSCEFWDDEKLWEGALRNHTVTIV